MRRVCALAAMAVMVMLQPAAGFAAESKAKGKAAAAATTKTCKYKLSTGQMKTWTCDKSQICCASEQFGLFTCGSQLLQCI